MDTRDGFKPGIKGLFFWLLFVLMYGIYRFFPVFPLSIFCGTNESNFQHYKAAFFAFLILALIEFLVYRRKITDRDRFWYPRLLSAVIAPWMVFMVWYFVPAVYGKLPGIVAEIIYSNISTAASGFLTVAFEKAFAQIKFNRTLKFIVLGLVLLMIIYSMIFTFHHLPWADVFIEPQWR